MSYRYQLDSSSKKFLCPNCEKKRFVRYVDTQTHEYLPEEYGRCDRDENCAYHRNPYTERYHANDYKFTSPIINKKPVFQKVNKDVAKEPSYISPEILMNSRKNYEENYFAKFLVNSIGVELASELIGQYHISTSNHWYGATIFWQIDLKGRIRSGKIMLYDTVTGRRVKHPYNHITWVHKALKLSDFNLRQCLFGEHLLKDNSMQVAIVESEKTAIIAKAYFPQFVWLAAGSKSMLSEKVCAALKDREVFLFPDLGAYNHWKNKIKILSSIAKFKVSDLLEKNASADDHKNGLDLADYLLRFDLQNFREDCRKLPEDWSYQELLTTHGKITNLINEYGYPANWD